MTRRDFLLLILLACFMLKDFVEGNQWFAFSAALIFMVLCAAGWWASSVHVRELKKACNVADNDLLK